MAEPVNVIGGGLAGSEAAYRLARSGQQVRLFEMRPQQNTPAHRSGLLAELVCSNSLKSDADDTAQGMLKREMRYLGSLILNCAEKVRVPAGSALAVDREKLASRVTDCLEKEPLVEIVRSEVRELPAQGCTVLCTGPLTSEALAGHLSSLTGAGNLSFYDAIAPSVLVSSIDPHKVYRASRYGRGSADYINCPLTREEYEDFYRALREADLAAAHEFDRCSYFQACMPVEEMAARGPDTLRFGNLRPVGLDDPGTGQRPYAVVQLRQEDLEGQIWGLVGFQTRLKRGDQQRVFRMIPGLEQAEFVRWGAMHRNSFLNSPLLLEPTLQMKQRPLLLVAGQLTGVEGYMESAATGILAGLNAARLVSGQQPLVLPSSCMLGALVKYICNYSGGHFQPMNANFGLLPVLENRIKKKNERAQALVWRGLEALSKMSELSEK